MTLTEMRALVAAQLGADNSVGGGQGFIDDDIEQARLEVLLETRVQQREGTLALVADTDTYTTPSSILAITSIITSSTGLTQTIRQVSVSQIQEMRSVDFPIASPVLYYAFAGHDLIIVYPSPGADTLTVTYVPLPTALAAGDSPPETPTAYHRAYVAYATRDGLKRREGAQDMQKIQFYDAEWQRYLQRIKKWTKGMGGPRPRVRMASSRFRIPHDPSTDLR